jgi:hypothetical protein
MKYELWSAPAASRGVRALVGLLLGLIASFAPSGAEARRSRRQRTAAIEGRVQRGAGHGRTAGLFRAFARRPRRRCERGLPRLSGSGEAPAVTRLTNCRSAPLARWAGGGLPVGVRTTCMGLFLSSSRFGLLPFFVRSGKAVLRPVACDQVRGARGRGQGTETLAKA